MLGPGEPFPGRGLEERGPGQEARTGGESDFLTPRAGEIAASFPCHPGVQTLQGGSGKCREEGGLPGEGGRGALDRSLGTGGGVGRRTQAARVTDLLWDRRPRAPRGLAPSSATQEGCMRWFTSQHSPSTYCVLVPDPLPALQG